MAAISLTEQNLVALKKGLASAIPDIRSSHMTEAIAAALKFRTNASLRSKLPSYCNDPPIVILNDKLFVKRLQKLGYPPIPMFRFESIKAAALIPTSDPRGAAIKYKSDRKKAWRNLLVCTVNKALDRKLFSLRPDDNRWPDNDNKGWLFDFILTNGLPARAYIHDANFAELGIHVAVHPKGESIRYSGSGFRAGEAVAIGWLERKRGAWLQSATTMFNCRRNLLKPLASIAVEPKGYGDRGNVIY